jgi:hypothetical protein
VGLFGSRRGASQGVTLHYRLYESVTGTDEQWAVSYAFEARLKKTVRSVRGGAVEDTTSGHGEVVFELRGPDAAALWAAVETEARGFLFRPAYALVRSGAPGTSPTRIDL